MDTARITSAPTLSIPRARSLRLALPLALPLNGRTLRRAGLLCLVGVAFAAPPAAEAPTNAAPAAPLAR